MEDTYLPLYQQSQYCAPCHYGIFWDTTIYNSYGEWLDSPYSSQGAALALVWKRRKPASSVAYARSPSLTVRQSPTLPPIQVELSNPLTIRAHTFQEPPTLICCKIPLR